MAIIRQRDTSLEQQRVCLLFCVILLLVKGQNNAKLLSAACSAPPVAEYSDYLNSAVNSSLLGLLFPQVTESRKVLQLDGIWSFCLAPEFDPDMGFRNHWYSQPLEKSFPTFYVIVPSNYVYSSENTAQFSKYFQAYYDYRFPKYYRFYPTWAWYDRLFRIPLSWTGPHRRIFVRISSAHYFTILYVNGVELMRHEGGGVPFVTEIPLSLLSSPPAAGEYLNGTDIVDMEGRITVAVNNTLTSSTIPQGRWYSDGEKRSRRSYLDTHIDFNDYAGILDSVTLYTTPSTFISDVDVSTEWVDDDGVAFLRYSILALSQSSERCSSSSVGITNEASLCNCTVELQDDQGNHVASSTEGFTGVLAVERAKLWWPVFTFGEKSNKNQHNVGYLYKLVVSLTDGLSGVQDSYWQNVGLRTVDWTKNSILINRKPFYFRGVAEPTAEASSNRRFYCGNEAANCTRRMFANSIMHKYMSQPVTEELMNMADRLGVVLIVQAPAVNLRNYSESLLVTHQNQLRELVQHTKNHASTVAWSLAKWPDLRDAKAGEYFRQLADYTRRTDFQKRPVTLSATMTDLAGNYSAESLDMLMLSYYENEGMEFDRSKIIADDNREAGGLDRITLKTVKNWRRLMRKPIVIGEYGKYKDLFACWIPSSLDTFHRQNSELDHLRTDGLIAGEMNWSCDQYFGLALLAGEYDLYFRKALCVRYAHLAGVQGTNGSLCGM